MCFILASRTKSEHWIARCRTSSSASRPTRSLARIFSAAAATSGVLLAPGAGSWPSVSDRNATENVAAVDGLEVLKTLSRIPISTWNYRTQDDSIRHMGPMAQDFRAAFGLGASDQLIDAIDPDGVALAAIQGLHAALQEKEARIALLEAHLERLDAELKRIGGGRD